MGPLHTAREQVKYLLLAIDYFTKWVEGRALATIKAENVTNFLWQEVICRFGIPRAFITDGGSQFDCAEFNKFCEDHHIQHRLTSVYNPQANGQIEVTNRTIKHGLKARLDEAKGAWVDHLPNVLWSYRTTQSAITKESPFSLAFGVEAVIPVELSVPSLRTQTYLAEGNEQVQRTELDLIEERREDALMKRAAYQQQVAKFYNARIKSREFRVGDLVLRKVQPTEKKPIKKLDALWEGPYRVVQVIKPGAYRLEDLDGTPIRRSQSVHNLRKYYQ